MTVIEPASMAYHPAEHHRFEADGKQFLYLVPSGAVFGLSGLSQEIFDLLQNCPLSREELTTALLERGYVLGDVETTLDEMEEFDVVSSGRPRKVFPTLPEEN